MSTHVRGVGKSIVPYFDDIASFTITLNDLATGSTAVSSAVNNSEKKWSYVEVELNINGTAAATAYCDVRIYKSTDGGTTYSTWESADALKVLNFSATPQVYHARFLAPEYFKIAIKNVTGASLGASGNTAKYQGIDQVLAW